MAALWDRKNISLLITDHNYCLKVGSLFAELPMVIFGYIRASICRFSLFSRKDYKYILLLNLRMN